MLVFAILFIPLPFVTLKLKKEPLEIEILYVSINTLVLIRETSVILAPSVTWNVFSEPSESKIEYVDTSPS